MTTYATSATHQHPQPGGPPAPPPQNAGGPPAQLTPRPRRTGIVAAASAFVIAAAATVGTAVALGSPITPAQHTVNVSPPPSPADYSSAEVLASKTTACEAWEQAALTTAAAARARAAVAPGEGAMDARFDARANEKRVSMSQVSFLRTQIEPAAPEDIVAPISAWIASEIDRLHFVNMRDWPAASAALQRGNDLVDVIAPACGLR